MEEVLWRITRQSRDFQDLRQEIRALWEDEAAREINGRYLNPHETETEEIIHALGQQHDALQQAENKLRKLAELTQRAHHYEARIDEAMRAVLQESSNAHASQDRYAQNHSAARTIVPLVYELINNANGCCS